MSHNRLYNVKNPNQGPAYKVLCLCSAGLLRSPTMAKVLGNPPYNYNTRAAGVYADYALIPVDEVLIEWADEIVCANRDVLDQLQAHFGKLEHKQVRTLNLPDRYQYGDPELIEQIVAQYDAI